DRDADQQRWRQVHRRVLMAGEPGERHREEQPGRCGELRGQGEIGEIGLVDFHRDPDLESDHSVEVRAVKINRLEAILVEVPLHQPVTGVHGRTTLQRSVLAHVVADDGREGWGNVDPTPGYSKISADGVQATAWLGRGFRAAKIKVAGATEEGIERVAAVRAAVGDRLALRVDFNESLTLAESAPFIRRLEPYALTLVEQPIPRDDIAGLAA